CGADRDGATARSSSSSAGFIPAKRVSELSECHQPVSGAHQCQALAWTRFQVADTRPGSACTYNLPINDVTLLVHADTRRGGSTRNTLRADRHALALAFLFFLP